MANNNTELSFVTEIGTFGSMNIKDQSVKKVSEFKNLAEETDNEDLKKFLNENMNIAK